MVRTKPVQGGLVEEMGVVVDADEVDWRRMALKGKVREIVRDRVLEFR